jgi:hypothetical protein
MTSYGHANLFLIGINGYRWPAAKPRHYGIRGDLPAEAS